MSLELLGFIFCFLPSLHRSDRLVKDCLSASLEVREHVESCRSNGTTTDYHLWGLGHPDPHLPHPHRLHPAVSTCFNYPHGVYPTRKTDALMHTQQHTIPKLPRALGFQWISQNMLDHRSSPFCCKTKPNELLWIVCLCSEYMPTSE